MDPSGFARLCPFALRGVTWQSVARSRRIQREMRKTADAGYLLLSLHACQSSGVCVSACVCFFGVSSRGSRYAAKTYKRSFKTNFYHHSNLQSAQTYGLLSTWLE